MTFLDPDSSNWMDWGGGECGSTALAEDILNQIDEALTDGAPVVALLDQADLLGGDRRSAIGFTPMLDSIDGHDMGAIVDVVKDAVHSHSQAVVCRSL